MGTIRRHSNGKKRRMERYRVLSTPPDKGLEEEKTEWPDET
jgi:hypothetical protein